MLCWYSGRMSGCLNPGFSPLCIICWLCSSFVEWDSRPMDFVEEGQQECFYGVNPAMVCFAKLSGWESLQKACWCLVWWNGVVRLTDPHSVGQRMGINPQQRRDEPRAVLYLAILPDIISHHSFPLTVLVFCLLYSSTQCSDVFWSSISGLLVGTRFWLSPKLIPSIPLSYTSQYTNTPTEADDRQTKYSDPW